MGKESPDNYEPSAEDLARAERLFRDIGTDNVLSDAENMDVLAAREEVVDRKALWERRMAITEEILRASDLLIQNPRIDFPQRKALEYVLNAAVRLLDPMNDTTEELRSKRVRDVLESAIAATRQFDPSAKKEEEAF